MKKDRSVILVTRSRKQYEEAKEKIINIEISQSDYEVVIVVLVEI